MKNTILILGLALILGSTSCKKNDSAAVTAAGGSLSVSSTAPADTATDVSRTTISIVFSSAVKQSSLVTNSTGFDCSGNIQVSKDDFVNCVPLTTTALSDSDTTATSSFATALSGNSLYKAKLTNKITDANGSALTGEVIWSFTTGKVITALAVTPTSPTIAGLTQQFVATGTYSDGSTQDLSSSVTWGSGTSATATIASSGLSTGAAIGTTNITASTAGITSPATTLTISSTSMKTLVINPNSTNLPQGLLKPFVATATLWDGSISNATETATWASGNTTAATITSGGVVTAIATGTSNVTATLNGLTNTAETTVTSVLASQFVYNASSITAFSADPTTGVLTAISGSPFATVTSPYRITIDPSGKFAYVISGTTNSVYGYSIDSTTGALTTLSGSPFATDGTTSQDIAIAPSGQFLYVTQSASNNISAFNLDATTGALTLISGSPYSAGTVPFGLRVDKTGRFLFVANSTSGDISVFSINSSTGGLTEVSGSPFDTGLTLPRRMRIHPTNKFIYITHQLSSGKISTFSINAETGALTEVTGSPLSTGSTPMGFDIDVTGSFLVLAESGGPGIRDNTIDSSTGALTLGAFITTGTQSRTPVIEASGKFVYMTNFGSTTINGYSMDSTTGAVTEITGSPFATGASAGTIGIAIWSGLR